MKKLLIDINSTVPFLVSGRVTGVGRTTRNLVSALGALNELLGFEVILISQNLKGIGVRQTDTVFKGFHIYAPNRQLINKFYKYLPVRELVTGYDLLHIPHNFDYVFNPSKTILTLHDALFMHMNEKAFDHLKMRKLVPRLAQKCKGIITCSEASKNDIVKYMFIDPSKIDIIHWGIDHEVFHQIADRDYVRYSLQSNFNLIRPYFLSVSCNNGRKNTHLLVEAYIKLLKNHPYNDLVLVWNEPPESIIEMIRKANATSRVVFLSNITDDELCLLYNGATALILPSSYEGFGLPVVEAMACGTPVITGNNSSLPEVGGNAPLYLDELTASGILRYLSLFEDKQVNTEELSKKGLKQAAQFNWGNTARQYIEVYMKHFNT